jgi:hypothetical protein
MALSANKIQQLIERHESGQILESDLNAFLENPTLWRGGTKALISSENAQPFWQGVYDELGLKVTVPAVPQLTEKQVKSIAKFSFLYMYIPAIIEDQYPEGFVKPAWERSLVSSVIEWKPFEGQWLAVETTMKPKWRDKDYPDDRLMVATKRVRRFGMSHEDRVDGLVEIAKLGGFPKKGTRLPTVEEWNFIGNLFNWLRENRSMNLPDLGSTNSWEWCENICTKFEGRIIVGRSKSGGLAAVHAYWSNVAYADVGFRVLVVL